jgi:hypothetical protein
LTLKVLGNLPQGTSIKNASFSIKLPLGITVVTTPTPDSGTAIAETTIPVGTAAVVGTNSSATLSATNGILNISLSSVTGFSTGDFLTIRYTDSSSYLLPNRVASDFVISGTAFFADIYKNQKLLNLTVIPESIVLDK